MADWITCFASTEVVTVPTPPGTGVAKDAVEEMDSKSTSPQSFWFSSILIPTSMIIVPVLIWELFSIFAFPAQAIRISAFLQAEIKSAVLV